MGFRQLYAGGPAGLASSFISAMCADFHRTAARWDTADDEAAKDFVAIWAGC